MYELLLNRWTARNLGGPIVVVSTAIVMVQQQVWSYLECNYSVLGVAVIYVFVGVAANSSSTVVS